MARYSEEFKSTTVRKVLLPDGPGAVAEEAGRREIFLRYAPWKENKMESYRELDSDTNYGYYSPGFFHITLNENYDDFQTMILESKDPTLFHEIIHFIQDTSTNYGLANITIVMNMIHAYWKHIIDNNLSVIEIPVKNVQLIGNLKANAKLFKLYNGDSNNEDIDIETAITNIKIKTENLIFDGKELSEPYYEAEIENKGKSILYKIGAVAFLESMARLAERLMFPDTEYPRSLKYNIFDLLNKHFNTNYSDVELLCIAESSLMIYHPQLATINLFEEPIYIEGTDIRSYYTLLLNRINTRTKNAIWPSFATAFHNATKSIDGIINNEKSKMISKWANNLIKRNYDLRCKEPWFLASIFHGSHETYYDNYLKLLDKTHIPLVTNGLSHLFTINEIPEQEGSKNMISVWLAIKDIFRKFYKIDYVQYQCTLIDFCSKLEDSQIDEDICNFDPWKKAEVNPLCNFGHVWKMWGFEGKPIKT